MTPRSLLKSIPGARALVSAARKLWRKNRQAQIVRRLKKGSDAPFQNDLRSGVVVSLTSFPARIHVAWRAIESIFQQDTKPAEVVLVLSLEEFPDRKIPPTIESQCDRGLTLLWTDENTRAYKKLLPTMRDFPDSAIVTVDDDVVYAPWMLGQLLEASRKCPNAVVGHRGRVITGPPRLLERYQSWPSAGPDSPPARILLTGVGGILYPAHLLRTSVFDNYALAKTLCPFNDDLWFWACTRLANMLPMCLGNHPFDAMDDADETESLYSVNGPGGMNDVQFKAVCDHFGLWDTFQ